MKNMNLVIAVYIFIFGFIGFKNCSDIQNAPKDPVTLTDVHYSEWHKCDDVYLICKPTEYRLDEAIRRIQQVVESMDRVDGYTFLNGLYIPEHLFLEKLENALTVEERAILEHLTITTQNKNFYTVTRPNTKMSLHEFKYNNHDFSGVIDIQMEKDEVNNVYVFEGAFEIDGYLLKPFALNPNANTNNPDLTVAIKDGNLSLTLATDTDVDTIESLVGFIWYGFNIDDNSVTVMKGWAPVFKVNLHLN